MSLSLEELLGLSNRDPQQQLASDLADEFEELVDDLVALRRKYYTQEQIARIMGVSQSAVARIESGERDPRLSTVRRYALAISARITTKVVDTRAPKMSSAPGRWPENLIKTPTQIRHIPFSPKGAKA